MAAPRSMTTRHFCTYFDHRYLAQGLSLHASLQRHAPDSTLWVLCLSAQCEELLRAARLPGMRLLPLAELEAHDPELAASRASRSLVEYYFTCSPCLPRYLLQSQPAIDAITYLDADLYFFSSPEPVFGELGDAQVGITPHRYPARRQAKLLQYGRYNVGWLTFRRGEQGLACLDWWRERCIAWCHDRVEPGLFADQKYLDRFPELFSSVHDIANEGANLAPWNVADAVISACDDIVVVNLTPLVFFHFQALKQVAPGTYDTNLDDYGARLTPPLEHLVYRPYLDELQRQARRIDALGGTMQRTPQLRSARGPRNPLLVLDRAVASMRARLHGSIIHG